VLPARPVLEQKITRTRDSARMNRQPDLQAEEIT